MTPFDLLSDFPLGPGDPRQALLQIRLFLLYLADHVERAELANGCAVRDATDFKMWCRELAERAGKIGKIPQGPEASLILDIGTGAKLLPPSPQKRWNDEEF